MLFEIRVAGFASESITDGPGIRFTLFMQGCPRRCEGCHNPTALSFDGGRLLTQEAVFESIRKNPLLSGVTFSGGEPFSQSEALLPLAIKIKEAGLELAIYTGYLFEELIEDMESSKYKLLSQADVLVDGPFILAKRDLLLHFRGSSNQRILNVSKSLQEGRAELETTSRWTGKDEQ